MLFDCCKFLDFYVVFCCIGGLCVCYVFGLKSFCMFVVQIFLTYLYRQYYYIFCKIYYHCREFYGDMCVYVVCLVVCLNKMKNAEAFMLPHFSLYGYIAVYCNDIYINWHCFFALCHCFCDCPFHAFAAWYFHSDYGYAFYVVVCHYLTQLI